MALLTVILIVMFEELSKSAVHFSESTASLSNSLKTTRQYLMSSYSDFYSATSSFILLVDTDFLCTRVHTLNGRSFTTFIHTNITITCLFLCVWSIFLALINIRTRIFFMFIFYIFTRTCYVCAFQFLPIHWSNYRFNSFNDVSKCFVDTFCSVNCWFNS